MEKLKNKHKNKIKQMAEEKKLQEAIAINKIKSLQMNLTKELMIRQKFQDDNDELSLIYYKYNLNIFLK